MKAGEMPSINTGANGVIRIPAIAVLPGALVGVLAKVDRLVFDEPWLSREQAAEFLGLSIASLKRLMEKQEFWIKPSGRTFLIRYESILDVLGAEELYSWQIRIPVEAPMATPSFFENPTVQEQMATAVAVKAYSAAYGAVMDWFRANAGTADQMALWPEPAAPESEKE